MSDGTVERGFAPPSQHHFGVAAGLAALTMISVAVFSLNPAFAAIPIAIVGAAVFLWAVVQVKARPTYLTGILALIELTSAAWFLTGKTRALFHYGLIAAFCVPLLPMAWRNRNFIRGGFKLYVWYFVWGAITITYSLAPEFSAGRMMVALMGFATVGFLATRMKGPDDIIRLLTPLFWACASFVVVVVLSAFLLPKSLVWLVPTAADAESAGGVIRFCSIFDGPNEIGGLMLVMVGCAAVLWPRARGGRRLLLAVLIVMALGAAAVADSRTPFVGLLVGGLCYLLWRYRGRAAFVLVLLAMAAAALHFKLDAGGYLDRGNVSTLTGRTDVWKFAISQIKERPLFGYGYEAGGAILQNRLFPVWWGPWDMGPQSSLHDGYIDRAVCVGIPALLLWLFIVLRPLYQALRRRDDPWGLKPLVFWMAIPMLIHNLAEASISDCSGLIGVSFFIVWAVSEKVRLVRQEQEADTRRREHEALSPAAAALTASVVLALALFSPSAARAHDGHFPTLPPHAHLPSGAQCAVEASRGTSWEPRPQNYAANHTVPSLLDLVEFHLAPVKGSFVPVSDFIRVDGNFTGTTDQILRWGACKWGIDEDIVRAQAVVESDWKQDRASDATHDPTQCPPGRGFNGAWDGARCQESYGIMQVKFIDFGGWPLPKNSTAFNVDFRLAYQRACMNGDISYLPQEVPPPGYPRYPHGSLDQVVWGCVGDWFSGKWYDAGAIHYIAEVKSALEGRKWAEPGF